ncbi:SH3 domain protein [Marinibacterium anthonyi]|nr:SH3 domain protein [Marinibacterium anthonyi]
MRFISGALSAVLVLLIGAVAYTALNPLAPRAVSATLQTDLPDISPAASFAGSPKGHVPLPSEAQIILQLPARSAEVIAARPVPVAGPAAPGPVPEKARATALDTALDMAPKTIPLPHPTVDARSQPPSTQSPLLPPDLAPELAPVLAPVLAPNLADPSTTMPPEDVNVATMQDMPVKRPVTWRPPADATAPEPPAIETDAAPVDMVYVSGKRVNMRSGPGSRYDWVASLARGTGLVLIEKRNRWYKVQTELDGRVVTGWMAASFLTTDRTDT